MDDLPLDGILCFDKVGPASGLDWSNRHLRPLDPARWPTWHWRMSRPLTETELEWRMEVDEFIASLEAENAAFYEALPETDTVYWTEPLDGLRAAEALKPRWFNEWRIGVDVIGGFAAKVDDFRLKIMLSKQIHDEGRHARMIDARIRAYGGTTRDYDPPVEQVAFAELLMGFAYPEEFFAAEQLTIETQSVRRNEIAASRFDETTSRMFAEKINPDERFHVKIGHLGHLGLRRYARTPAARDRARRAVTAVRDIHRKMVASHNRRMEAIAS